MIHPMSPEGQKIIDGITENSVEWRQYSEVRDIKGGQIAGRSKGGECAINRILEPISYPWYFPILRFIQRITFRLNRWVSDKIELIEPPLSDCINK